MHICKHCGAGIPNYAGFCGTCGQLISIGELSAQDRTVRMSQHASTDQAQTMVISEGESEHMTGQIEEKDTHENVVVDNKEEDDEKRNRALVDYSLPPLADPIIERATEDVPTVVRTPQVAGAPTVVGTPQSAGVDNLPSSGGEVAPFPLVLPDPGKVHSGQLVGGPQRTQGPDRPLHLSNRQQPQRPGCMTSLLVSIIVLVIILSSLIGIGFTILAPTLVLDGSTNVARGDAIHLNGGHFIPGDTVTCVLDGGIPLSRSSSSIPYPTRGGNNVAGALMLAHSSAGMQHRTRAREANANTIITVGGDGTFHVTFMVRQDWTIGQHTIHATEALSPRSATITFTITGNGQAVGTAASGKTSNATATVTASSTPAAQVMPGLSAITPNAIMFGPLSEGYTHPISTQIIINTGGKGRLAWTATWDRIQAPWLRLNVQSGQIQEPNGQILVASAVASGLKAGTYHSTITFRSNGQSLALPISLIVQVGCIQATPNTLNFTGTIGANDPPAQTVALNNCGALGNWTETTTGGSWLLVSPTGGTLNNGATQDVVVSVALANAKSGAGAYQGQIVFSNGSIHVPVNVALTVQGALRPMLGTNITSISVSRQCKVVQTLSQCSIITLNSTGTLDWTATSSGTVNMTVNPTGGTLQAGQTAAIEIDIPHIVCVGSATIGRVTFSGPTNSIVVTISC